MLDFEEETREFGQVYKCSHLLYWFCFFLPWYSTYVYIYMHIKSSMICLMNSRGKKQANLTDNNLLEVWRFVDYIRHEDIIGNLPN